MDRKEAVITGLTSLYLASLRSFMIDCSSTSAQKKSTNDKLLQAAESLISTSLRLIEDSYHRLNDRSNLRKHTDSHKFSQTTYIIPPIIQKAYNRGCTLYVTTNYKPADSRWTSKAAVYWIRGKERHVAVLKGPAEGFDSRSAAQDHAISLAFNWCDEHIISEAVPQKRCTIEGRKIR